MTGISNSFEKRIPVTGLRFESGRAGGCLFASLYRAQRTRGRLRSCDVSDGMAQDMPG